MHYHRLSSVSLPCSEWERVGPLRKITRFRNAERGARNPFRMFHRVPSVYLTTAIVYSKIRLAHSVPPFRVPKSAIHRFSDIRIPGEKSQHHSNKDCKMEKKAERALVSLS